MPDLKSSSSFKNPHFSSMAARPGLSPFAAINMACLLFTSFKEFNLLIGKRLKTMVSRQFSQNHAKYENLRKCISYKVCKNFWQLNKPTIGPKYVQNTPIRANLGHLAPDASDVCHPRAFQMLPHLHIGGDVAPT